MNKGKAQNNGVWYIYGALKNEGTYIAKNRRSGVINAFSGSFLIGMPETTVFAVYGDCYYADGTFRKSDQATDIQTDRNITLRTSGAVLSAFAFGQEGYDQAVKSDTAYEGLYLIADKEENNTLRLSPKYTGPEWLTFIGDGVTARVSNGTAAPGVLEVYGTLEIAAAIRFARRKSAFKATALYAIKAIIKLKPPICSRILPRSEWTERRFMCVETTLIITMLTVP